MFSMKQPPALAPDERYRRAGAPKRVRSTNRAPRATRSVDLSVRKNSGLTSPAARPVLPLVATFSPHLSRAFPAPGSASCPATSPRAHGPLRGCPASGTLPRPGQGFLQVQVRSVRTALLRGETPSPPPPRAIHMCTGLAGTRGGG